MSRKILIYGFLGICALALGGFFYIELLFRNLPNPTLFDQRQVAQSTKIYDKTGEVLLYELYGEQKRTVIPFEEIPEIIKNASLIIEDKEFYNHPAFDWKSIIRAAIINLTSGRIVQGGSTITQQLAKNAFLSSERTINRKIKELLLAFRLEKKYTKDQILNLYLNQIPYGTNAYGIEAAAQTYFQKKAKNLNLAEAALLASLPKAPSYYSPWGEHKEELTGRKNYIIDQMAAAKMISEEEAAEAKKIEIEFAPQTISINAPHFVITIQDYLNSHYGEDFVRSAGLKVTTTLDWKMQQLAEKVVAEGAENNEKLYKGKNAALVAQDAKTGQILALVGSRNYFDEEVDGNFNVATQGLRQPGSAIKPIAYLTAFIKGYTPDSIVFDLETEFNTTDEEEKSYKPQNYDEQFRGPVTMRNGLAQSINVPSVKTLYLAGLDETLKNAKKMGITTLTERSRYGLSLALGGGEVKLIDLVGAYSVFSQDGIKHKQVFILKIEDSQGEIIEEYKDQSEQIIEPQYVRLINDILTDIEARSLLFSNSLSLTVFPNQEVALKTGTTNDYRDAWAMGYTPSLTVGVWAGNNDNQPMEKRGGSILAAVPIWNAFLKEALKETALETFPRPEVILVDKPILKGEYIINNEIHDILYYIDKNNPQGQSPSDPKKDSQFENWEKVVRDWAQINLPALSNNNPNNQSVIEFLNLQNGQTITNPLNISIKIKSSQDITKLETYFNDKLIDQKFLNLGKEFDYQMNFDLTLELQNKFTIKTFDVLNNIITKEIILYSNGH
ncbi:MAG: PBP1A family penicillin-binding protein [Nanoarchaeota archaeon]